MLDSLQFVTRPREELAPDYMVSGDPRVVHELPRRRGRALPACIRCRRAARCLGSAVTAPAKRRRRRIWRSRASSRSDDVFFLCSDSIAPALRPRPRDGRVQVAEPADWSRRRVGAGADLHHRDLLRCAWPGRLSEGEARSLKSRRRRHRPRGHSDGAWKIGTPRSTRPPALKRSASTPVRIDRHIEHVMDSRSTTASPKR